MTIVFCPGKLIGCPGYFFHDLGRIHASLIRLPYCSKLMSLGLVVLILSLTSAPIARLSPQVWLARSTCALGLRQSNWQFWMGQSLIITCVLYCAPFVSLIQRYFTLAQPRSGHCFTFSRVGHLRSPLSLNSFGSLLATRDSHT